MWLRILEWLRRIVDRRICTVEDFNKACDIAKTRLETDADGYISIGESAKLIAEILVKMRMK